MKKIFTLATAAATALAMSAADFTIYHNGEAVENGASYTQGYTVVITEEDGETYRDCIQESHLSINGVAGTEVTIEVVLCEGSETGLQFCWPNGCKLVNSTEEPTVSEGKLEGEVEDLQIHGLPAYDVAEGTDPSFAGDLIFTVKAYETNDPEEFVTFTMTLTTEETSGVKSVAANTQYVKAIKGNVLAYNVDAPSTLSVYAITGRLAAKYQIANAGTLNVGNLSKGVYVYTTGNLSGKFVVR